MSSCWILGGDKRQTYLAETLKKNHWVVSCFATEQQPKWENIPRSTGPDVILLPIPVTKDGFHLYSPFCQDNIPLSDMIPMFPKNSTIFGGCFPFELLTNLRKTHRVFDYGIDEGFQSDNAIPSAEGAIAVALTHTPFVLHGAKVCVVGFGKIGKELTARLVALGAEVTATARRIEQFAEIEAMGALPYHTSENWDNLPYDIIYNTVPFPVIPADKIAKLKGKPLLIDLASKPGGIDPNAAKNHCFPYIHALSLPARFSPQTAANIIANAVQSILQKEDDAS